MNFNQKIIKTIVVVGVLTLGVFSSNLLKENISKAQDVSNKKTIQVSGQYKLKVKPDIAYVTLGVQTEDKSAETAQTKNSGQMDDITKSLKALGIDSSDIQTSNYSIYPKYDYQNIEANENGKKITRNEQVLLGYEVNNSLYVKIRDTKKVGTVLTIAAKKGCNIVNGVQFNVADTEKYYKDALKQAVTNAKGKADAVAEAINVKLDKPSQITEQSSGGEIVRPYSNMAMKSEAMATDSAVPIEEGQVEVTAQVNVIYEY